MVSDAVAAVERGRPPGRPHRLLAGQVAAEHWDAATPKPVLRGGFVALKALVERFLDAGCTPGQVLWALRHTRAYTVDAVTFTIRQASTPAQMSPGDAAAVAVDQFVAHYTAHPQGPALAPPTVRPLAGTNPRG